MHKVRKQKVGCAKPSYIFTGKNRTQTGQNDAV